MTERSSWQTRLFRPAIENVVAARRRVVLLAVVLAVPIAAALVQHSMAAAVSASVSGAYQRPQDKIVVVATGTNPVDWITREQADAIREQILSQLGPRKAGWSRSLEFADRSTGIWQQLNLVEIREVSPDYLRIVSRASMNEVTCASCLLSEGRAFALGAEIIAPDVEPGGRYELQNLQLVFGGWLQGPWRDARLGGAAVVTSATATLIGGGALRPGSFAVKFHSVPTDGQIAALRALVQPNAPERTEVEALIGSDDTRDFVQRVVGSSSTAIRIALVVSFLSVSVGSNLLQFQRRRTEVAVIRALGATRRDVLGVAWFEGVATGAAGFAVAFAIASVAQGFLISSAPEVFQPMSFAVLAVAGASACALSGLAAVLAAGPASRLDPADVIRSSGE